MKKVKKIKKKIDLHTTILDGKMITSLKLRYIHTLVLSDDNGQFVNMLEFCESKQPQWAHLTQHVQQNEQNEQKNQKNQNNQNTQHAIVQNPPQIDNSQIKSDGSNSNQRYSNQKKSNRLQQRLDIEKNEKNLLQKLKFQNLIIPTSLFDASWFPPGHAYAFLNHSFIEPYLQNSQYNNLLRHSTKIQKEQRSHRQTHDISSTTSSKYGPLRPQYQHHYYPTVSSNGGKNIKNFFFFLW